MKRIAIVAATVALFTLPTRAADKDTDATSAADAALADRAEPFATPPTLPESASARAREVAFGQQGARERSEAKAHGEASEQGKDAAGDADVDAANRAAHGAAAAAGAANADSHAAAGQARAAEVRSGAPGTRGHGH